MEKIRALLVNKKRLVIVSLVCIGVIFGGLLLLRSTGEKSSKNGSYTSVTEGQRTSATSQDANETQKQQYNPLINPKDVEQVENGIRQKMKQSGNPAPEKKKTHFQYKIDPALEGKSSFLPIQSVFAAESCNIAQAPSQLTIYTLQNHVDIGAAKKIASVYEIFSDPSGSMPSLDGGTFDYFFADPSIIQYLTVTEPSGVTYYHRVLDENSTVDVGLTKAQLLAQDALIKHDLFERTALKEGKYDPKTGTYIVHYQKAYDDYIMTDRTTLSNVGTTETICSTKPTQLMNYIDVGITKNGQVLNLMNKTRKITGAYTAPRQSLADAIKEYQASPPVEPIVIGADVTTGDVTIDEATLVLYDYGELFPQVSYMPMYLTNGKTQSGSRVLTLFPAVSKQELSKTPLADAALTQSQDMLQLRTFNPRIANAPPPPITPPSVTKTVTPGKTTTTGSVCSGGKVDYMSGCYDSEGSTVCQGPANNLPADQYDQWGICKGGCQTKSGTIDAPAGTNPCEQFLKQSGLPLEKMSVPPLYRPYKGGKVECKIQGCPC